MTGRALERLVAVVLLAIAVGVAALAWTQPHPFKPDSTPATVAPYAAHSVTQFLTVAGFDITHLNVGDVYTDEDGQTVAQVIVDLKRGEQVYPRLATYAVMEYGWHAARLEPSAPTPQPHD